MGNGRIFLKSLGYASFNKDLSNESNFDRIHLAGQYLQVTSYFSSSVLALCVQCVIQNVWAATRAKLWSLHNHSLVASVDPSASARPVVPATHRNALPFGFDSGGSVEKSPR
jgi:hypothetical protein